MSIYEYKTDNDRVEINDIEAGMKLTVSLLGDSRPQMLIEMMEYIASYGDRDRPLDLAPDDIRHYLADKEKIYFTHADYKCVDAGVITEDYLEELVQKNIVCVMLFLVGDISVTDGYLISSDITDKLTADNVCVMFRENDDMESRITAYILAAEGEGPENKTPQENAFRKALEEAAPENRVPRTIEYKRRGFLNSILNKLGLDDEEK